MIATGTAWKNSTRIGHGEGGKGVNQKKFSYKLDIVSKYFVLPKKLRIAMLELRRQYLPLPLEGRRDPPLKSPLIHQGAASSICPFWAPVWNTTASTDDRNAATSVRTRLGFLEVGSLAAKRRARGGLMH